MKKTSGGQAKGYLHGYTSHEQKRLYSQANFLEPWIYRDIDLSKQKKLIEVGCGVGAQTAILRKRFPNLHITGVDISKKQIDQAKRYLAQEIRARNVELHRLDATQMSFDDSVFDGAFLCWCLEHVPDPVAVLKETRRILRAGSVIYCSEVQNASFYVHPYSPATIKYWFEFNDHQWSMKGDPFVGAKLGNLLQEAGFQDVQTSLIKFHFDSRAPKHRAEFIAYWTELLLSGAPGLLQAKRVTQAMVDEMTEELKNIAESSESVFFYTAMRAKAYAS